MDIQKYLLWMWICKYRILFVILFLKNKSADVAECKTTTEIRSHLQCCRVFIISNADLELQIIIFYTLRFSCSRCSLTSWLSHSSAEEGFRVRLQRSDDHWAGEWQQCPVPGPGELWLGHTCHVTVMLTSDWSRMMPMTPTLSSTSPNHSLAAPPSLSVSSTPSCPRWEAAVWHWLASWCYTYLN